MKFLSRIEEMLLLAIWKLQDNAYGISIREQVERDSDTRWQSGAIYAPLKRLQNNGYVHAEKSSVSTELGGRPRIYYRLTELGMEKLTAIQTVNNALWTGVPDLKKDG